MTEPKENTGKLITELVSKLVDTLLKNKNIRTKPVEEAFRSVPRHLFVDRYYVDPRGADYIQLDLREPQLVEVDFNHPTPAQLEKIYRDDPLASHCSDGIVTSSTSQPAIVADMLEWLVLKPGMKALEIGSGTGWNAALMGHIVGAEGHVHSMDIQEDAAQRARVHIQQCGFKNVEIITGDGGYGYPEAAPYDRIITTANCPEISPHWIQQLAEGAMLLVTMRDMECSSRCLLMRLWKHEDHVSGKIVGTPGFIALQGKYGAKVMQSSYSQRLEIIGSGRKPRYKPVPWGVSSDPGSILTRVFFIDRHFVFFAYLEGMIVEDVGNGHFALYTENRESVCVTSAEQIEIYGNDDVYRTLEEISRKWIELGKPSITQYLVEIWPLSLPKRKPENGWLVKQAHTQLIFRLRKGDPQ